MSYTGLPQYGKEEKSINSLLDELIPDEKQSYFHQAGYAKLSQGIYEIESANTVKPWQHPPFLDGVREKLSRFGKDGKSGRVVVIIEDWQAGLKKVTLRVLPRNDSNQSQTLEKVTFVHKRHADV